MTDVGLWLQSECWPCTFTSPSDTMVDEYRAEEKVPFLRSVPTTLGDTVENKSPIPKPIANIDRTTSAALVHQKVFICLLG
jgi:hypothetical protein